MKKHLVSLAVLWVFACGVAFAQDAIVSGDRIRVWVKGESDLTVERPVQSDGSIDYPLLGSVGVAGLKPYEAAKVISKLLDDGFLRDPLVQVDFVAKNPRRKAPTDSDQSEESSLAPPATTNTEKTAPTLPRLSRIDIVDGKTGSGIGGAALFMGGKIYQTNRLGQLVVDGDAGNLVLIADGYRILEGPVERFLKAGPVPRIIMDRMELTPAVSIKVIDGRTGLPLEGVTVKLDGMSVKTNKQGVFRIKEIQREFGEVQLSKKGFRSLRKVIDFKGPALQVVPLLAGD